ncbi:MAG: hypothetical protein KIT24_01885 [Phycisphaeraceae bacterium]|nr:hypothetical protein [Phycisphaeraceae bacterium]
MAKLTMVAVMLTALTAPAWAAWPTDPPKVALKAAGEEPREALRFTIERGIAQDVTMTTTMSSSTMVDGQPFPPVTSPTMVIAMRMRSSEVRPDGTYRYEYEVVRADIRTIPDGQEAAAGHVQRVLRSMIGLRGWGRNDARGRPLENDLRPPPGIDPSIRGYLDAMKEQLSQMSTMLPEEPVGHGASWTVETRVVAAGLPLRQVSTYTLTKRTGQVLDLKVEVEQEALEQTVKTPDGEFRIEEWLARGAGEMRLDLGAPAPVRSVMRTSATTEMSSMAEGRRQTLRQQQYVDMVILSERRD